MCAALGFKGGCRKKKVIGVALIVTTWSLTIYKVSVITKYLHNSLGLALSHQGQKNPMITYHPLSGRFVSQTHQESGFL
jgi:hypothetical protein